MKKYIITRSTIATIFFTFVVVGLLFFILKWGNFLITSGYIMKKMNNISKLKYIGNLNIMGDKIKNYIVV